MDHLDGNKDNNTIWNLEWVTPQENIHRAISNGQRPLSLTATNMTLLTDDQAFQLYLEALKVDPEHYSNLGMKYGVTAQYVSYLVRGAIRPYIAYRYYHSNHVTADKLNEIRNNIKY